MTGAVRVGRAGHVGHWALGKRGGACREGPGNGMPLARDDGRRRGGAAQRLRCLAEIERYERE